MSNPNQKEKRIVCVDELENSTNYHFLHFDFTPESVGKFEPPPSFPIEYQLKSGQTHFHAALLKSDRFAWEGVLYRACKKEHSARFLEGVENALFFGRENLKHNPRAHAYLKKRGISLKTALALGIGWVSSARFSKKKDDGTYENFESEATLSTMKNEYGEVIGFEWRGVDADFKRGETKTSGEKCPWNLRILERESRPIFLCEGIFSAASLIEMGELAIPMFSAQNWNFIANFCAKKSIRSPLIFALDNDKAGQDAWKNLLSKFCDGSQFAGVRVFDEPFFRDGVEWGVKDTNDLLLADSALLKERINEILEKCAGYQHFIKTDFSAIDDNGLPPPREFINAGELKNDFHDAILKNKRMGAIPTFSTELNNAMGGGFKPERLYGIAAQPALGKTALAIQLACAAGQAGRRVLFFSLELSKTELLSRIMSRISFEFAADGKIDKGFSFDEIWGGEIPDADFEKVWAHANDYFLPNIFFENGAGFGETQIDSIHDAVADFCEQRRGEPPPLVIVDYFQIIDTDDERQTDKQRADEAISKLKKIALEFCVPVLLISAIARANYKNELGLDAAKESGKVEYTLDFLIGVGIKTTDDSDDEAPPIESKVGGAKPKKEKPEVLKQKKVDEYFESTRAGGAGELELKIIKNRAGKAGQKFSLFFNPLKNLFTESPEAKFKIAGFRADEGDPFD